MSLQRRPLWRSILTVAVLAACNGLTSPIQARAATPGFITVLFGRTQYTSVDGPSCQALPNTITLDQAADAMAARGFPGVGNVVVNRTPDSGVACTNDTLASHPGWDWLNLRSTQGWRFISAGMSYANMTTLSYADQVQESCGSLAAFNAHGLDGAQGMFAYPNDKWSVAIQTDPVSTCFDYGRRYGPGTNGRTQVTTPWFASVWSVNGGKCNDPTQACYSSAAPQRYTSPDALAAAVRVAPDSWFNVQFYRFVTGSYTSGHSSWDCTSSDWRRHWSSRTELYCFDDFLLIMDAVQAAMASGAVVTDPHTVALTWGRTPPPPIHRPDGQLAVGSGAFVGNNVVNGDGTDQSIVDVPIGRGTTVSFRWRIQNDGSQSELFSLRGQPASAGFSVRFWSGTAEITSSVLSGTYARSISPGAYFQISLTLRALSSATTGMQKTELLVATSSDGSATDAVLAGVSVS